MVPRTVFRIWLSEGEIPSEYITTGESFGKLTKGTVVNVRNDSFEWMHNNDLYKSTPYNVRKSDLLRLELIYRFGGIYSDMDVVCLRDWDFLDVCDAFVCTTGPANRIGNFVFGAKRHHPWLKAVIENVRWEWIAEPASIDEYCCSIDTLHRVTQGFSDVDIMPPNAFCPIPFWDRNNESQVSRVKDHNPHNSYAVHLWHGGNGWVREFLNNQPRIEQP